MNVNFSSDNYTTTILSDSSLNTHLRVTSDKGIGDLHVHQAFPGLFVSEFDFALPEFPAGLSSEQDWSGWIVIHYCKKGRCELTLPGNRTTIIKQGDCSIYSCTMLPSQYRFPLKHYSGTAVFLQMDILRDSCYSLLKESSFPANAWLLELEMGPATFSDTPVLEQLTDNLCDMRILSDPFISRLRLMELLHVIDLRGLTNESQTASHTQEQIEIARATHEMLTSDPGKPYNLKAVAADYNISLSTLNNYFKAVYGEYIPAFIRICRLKLAATLLTTTTLPVYEVAARVGYANPSKFGTAFRKIYGANPNEYRIQANNSSEK